MKKLYTLVLALATTFSFAQGLETFENHALEGNSYVDGSFVGDNGITWNYGQVTGEQTFPIDGKGIMLRRHSPLQSSLSATISGGIGNFSVDIRKAFTGNAVRQVELVINGNVAGQFVHTFAEGEDAAVETFTVNNINVSGSVELVLRVFGTETASTNRQVVIDNLTWTAPNLGVNQNSIEGLKVYPNPVTNGTLFIDTTSDASKAVVIYDVLGKQVVNTTTQNAVNVSNLKGGVYIVKITEEGKTATRKLVIR